MMAVSGKTTFENARLDRTRPLRDQVYDLLRDAILRSILAPGEVVDEKAIAAGLGISRTPVHEATKKLSDEKLIEIKAQSGTRVARMTRHKIKEANLIRRILEVESAGIAASLMTDEAEGQLKDILMLHAAAIDRQRFDVAISLDDDFHRVICELSSYPMLWRAIEISKAPLDIGRHSIAPREGEGAATMVEHGRILDALEKRDPDLARKAMSLHLERVLKKALASFDEVLGGATPEPDQK
jgi:DNA-binding GntR family transcriptional regulator